MYNHKIDTFSRLSRFCALSPRMAEQPVLKLIELTRVDEDTKNIVQAHVIRVVHDMTLGSQYKLPYMLVEILPSALEELVLFHHVTVR